CRELAARWGVFFLGRPHRLGQIFEIDLVANAGARRPNPKIVERVLTPFEKAVALAIAAIFELDIGLKRLAAAKGVDDDRMIDHEIDGHERIDLLRIAAEFGHGVAHRGQIDNGGYAGEVLHEDPRRTKRYLAFGAAFIPRPG